MTGRPIVTTRPQLGSTRASVPRDVRIDWKVKLGGPLTAPVAAGGKVYVAKSEAHTLYALDVSSGKMLWEFTAGGRIDSPPTICKGLVLLGSKDGRVYCLRASDGQLVWRFLAAPADRRIASYDQIESVWPVPGSVLVDNDVAYFAAGRSTYLDGGIRVYGLEPAPPGGFSTRGSWRGRIAIRRRTATSVSSWRGRMRMCSSARAVSSTCGRRS